MPVVAAHIGSKQITFLVVESPKDYQIIKYPFVFSDPLFSQVSDEPTFYTAVFKQVLRQNKIPIDSCEFLLCSEFRPTPINIDVKANEVFGELFMGIEDTTVFYMNSFLSFPISQPNELGLENFLSNLSIAPQMSVQRPKANLFLDSVLTESYKNSLENVDSSRSILFCGDKFSSEWEDEKRTYLFVLNSIKTPGFFEITVDTDGVFVPLCLLKKYSPDLYNSLSQELSFRSLGTVLKAGREVECLFKTDISDLQFFEVPAGDLFFIPLEESTTASVSVKSPLLGQCEKDVVGGKLGFVVDTGPFERDLLDGGISEEEIVSSETNERQIEEVLNKL